MTWCFSPPISQYPKLFHLQERLKTRLIQTTDQILLGSQWWKGWRDYLTVRSEPPLSLRRPKGHTTKYDESQAVISAPSAIHSISKKFFCSKTQRSTSNFMSSLLSNEISSNKKLIWNEMFSLLYRKWKKVRLIVFAVQPHDVSDFWNGIYQKRQYNRIKNNLIKRVDSSFTSYIFYTEKDRALYFCNT